MFCNPEIELLRGKKGEYVSLKINEATKIIRRRTDGVLTLQCSTDDKVTIISEIPVLDLHDFASGLKVEIAEGIRMSLLKFLELYGIFKKGEISPEILSCL